MFTESILKEIDSVKERYPDQESALLPVLYIAQREFGWLSEKALTTAAAALNLPEATVRGTASFYSMFRHKEMGRNLVQLCTNISCMILGSEKLVDILQTKFNLKPGETTEDGRFSLVIMECIGACGSAPAMLVNTDYYDNLTEESIMEILKKYK